MVFALEINAFRSSPPTAPLSLALRARLGGWRARGGVADQTKKEEGHDDLCVLYSLRRVTDQS